MKKSRISKIFQVRIHIDHKFFFAPIHLSISPFLWEIEPKIWFFDFLKTLKKCYLTRKFELQKNWLYDFFWFSGFGSKHSIAIFSTTPNRFWTRFDGFRWVLKSRVFEKIALIFNIFFHFFAFKNMMKFDISLTYPCENHSFSIQNIAFLLKNITFLHMKYHSIFLSFYQ